MDDLMLIKKKMQWNGCFPHVEYYRVESQDRKTTLLPPLTVQQHGTNIICLLLLWRKYTLNKTLSGGYINYVKATYFKEREGGKLWM